MFFVLFKDNNPAIKPRLTLVTLLCCKVKIMNRSTHTIQKFYVTSH